MKRKGIRLLTLVLCCILLLGVEAGAATPGENEIAALLSRMSILAGYPDGELHLDRNVSRAEFAKIAIAASPYKNRVASGMTISPFADVKYDHWAAPYVKLAVSNKLVTGYPDSTFRPGQSVLLEEAVTVYLKLLGYTEEDFGYSWPYGQMGLADNLGLTENVSAAVGSELTRRDVMLLTYNLLTTPSKNSSADYIESIQYKIAEDIVLVATHEEDSSVTAGYVATSAGLYEIDDSFRKELLGSRGDAVLKNQDELVCFIPYDSHLREYVVYSKLNDVLVTYDNGIMGELNLDSGVTVYQGMQKTTYGAASANISMGDVVSVKRDEKNAIEYISVRKGDLRGPVIVRSNTWNQSLSIGTQVNVMRDGTKCSLSDIKTHDVVYYSESLNMVLAYSKKVTGIYETATPNKDQPTHVTVSGVTYALESAESFHSLSSGGQLQYGDTVTLLLGKDGGVAGVQGSQTETSLVGYLYGAGVKEYTNQAGETYSDFYVTVIGMDGASYEYAAKRDYSDSDALNQVVMVTFSEGKANVASHKRQNLSGTVDSGARKIGTVSISDSVRILDVIRADKTKQGAYAPVFLQRLDGMTLTNSDVLYYETDSSGKITELILDDVTGECYSYGVILGAESRNTGMNIGGSYQYDISGQTGSTTTSGTIYSVAKGEPAMFLVSGGRVQGIKALEKLADRVKSVTGNVVKTVGGESYTMSDKAVIYKKTGNDYTIIPASELSSEAYLMTAYYDSSLNRGGRIRVIVAERK